MKKLKNKESRVLPKTCVIQIAHVFDNIFSAQQKNKTCRAYFCSQVARDLARQIKSSMPITLEIAMPILAEQSPSPVHNPKISPIHLSQFLFLFGRQRQHKLFQLA